MGESNIIIQINDVINYIDKLRKSFYPENWRYDPLYEIKNMLEKIVENERLI